MEKCGSLSNSVRDTLVLAIKVAETSVLESPQLIQKVLEDPAVRAAIEKAALDEARRLITAQRASQKITNADGEKALEAVGSAAGTAALSSVKKQIEQTSAFRSLKKELKTLQCSFEQSPIGVFVDKNKGWLIVVGAGLGIAGATAMYMFRSGDFIAAKAAEFAGKSLRFTVLGNVELGATKVTFVPSNQQVGATLFAEAKWKPVSVRFEASVDVKEGDLTAASGKASTNINIAKGLVLTADGSAGYAAQNSRFTYHLGMGITWKEAFGTRQLNLNARAFIEQTPDALKTAGAVNAKLDIFRLPDHSSLSLGLSGEYNNTRYFDPLPNAGKPQGNEWKGMLMLEWRTNILGK